MRRLHARLAATCALAVATALFTAVFVGAALADPGHGNSANAPGHQTQEQPAQQPQQAPQQQQQQQSAPQQDQSRPGVKPSSTTKHWTHTTVGANPDVSKRYGNGKTAAEIAESRGAPDSQPLTGPGNSQPHKTYDCRHKNNKSGGVDVHAIKSYSSTGCASVASPAKPSAPPAHPTKPTAPVSKAPVSKAPVKTPEQPGEQHVTICHATGTPDDAGNGYVIISPSASGVYHGHYRQHEADIIPPFTYQGQTYSANWDANGQAIFNNGCKPVVAAQAPVAPPAAPHVAPPAAPTPPPTTTVAETPVTTTTTVPVTTTVTVTTESTATTTVAAGVGATTTTTGSSGGVLGAQTSLAKPKPAAHPAGQHGVLGTVTHVTGGTLPFTGFPVWLAVLIGAALILGGFALRRRTAGARL